LVANDYGQFDGLIGVLTTALGQTGLEHLRQRMIDLSNRPVAKPADKDRVKIGWSSEGPIYADEMAERSCISTVRHALQDIADAMGDADAFIEQFDEQARKVPKIAATMTGTGRTSNGRTRASMFSTRWAAPAMPKTLAGSASSARYRRAISGPT
jgi:Family of unknown function (DUF6880)